MAKTSASLKPSVCTNGAATAPNRRITTYPVRLTEPPTLAGREIHVGRVALYVCRACGHLMPTAAGFILPGGSMSIVRAIDVGYSVTKIVRCVVPMTGISPALSDSHLRPARCHAP